jgi:type I restriction-modification system DNA methylase subunit/REP element-mobilizing transposase RayT
MSLFQNSVLQKYLNRLDASVLETKYNEFVCYFGNPDIQENIRNSKEEQFQEGFLRELFVRILGYTLNPSANFNLTTEYKNVKDSKKADGAIVIEGIVKAVIELKGTNVTDLSKVEAQAFGYKNNQPDCVYVITSNFEKLRFYIDNAIEFEEFNLFSLSKHDFGMLYVCLSYDNLSQGIPRLIKTESLSQEDIITKKLYQDYSFFKRELHQNLVKQNLQYDPLTLLKKSQKLLDRFLFLFFAEDRQLLPPNSVRLILNDWRDLQERDEVVPLYNRFKKYFGYLNSGFKGKRYDVFAYNGGLFKPDDVLDSVTIDDALLYKHTLILSEYNFVSEVDVNILGHIFENSLNELDEVKARIEGHDVDKTKTRRKKEGIFYTPKYITKYIVENTVGKLCAEKKAEIQLNEEDYTPDRKRTVKTKQPLADKLKDYRNWLLQLTICDPACGSGAFLNQALDFLIAEHRYVDELQARLFGDTLILSDIEKSILENNLFGVDLNEESIEIAKLSLWLRTSQPNRKLNDLNSNIKCGNSLIDDPAVAGDKAFNWQQEFPKIFRKKEKKAWHITCATHNSRYSQRMFDNFVKLGEPVWLTAKEEIIVSETIAEISAKDKLNIPTYNICGDHMHLILVCEESELASIVQKIKSMSARACNIAMGRTIPTGTREHAPAATALPEATREHAPAATATALPLRGETQSHLWTQKFGQNEITSERQLHNTIAYIRNNRVKHGLSPGTGYNTGACSRVYDAAGDATGYATTGACSRVTDAPPGTPAATGDENLEIEALCQRISCSIDHAFRTEYTGGFDVVIGNPPYVPTEHISGLDKIFLEKTFDSAFGRINLYPIFYEKGIDLLKERGILGFITPYTILKNQYYKEARKYILENSKIIELVDFKGNVVFQDAAVDSIVLLLKREISKQYTFKQISHVESFEDHMFKEDYFNISEVIENEDLSFLISSNDRMIKRIIENSVPLKTILNFKQGIITGANSNFLTYDRSNQTKNVLTGGDFNRYCKFNTNQLIVYDATKLHRARTKDIFEVREKILLRQTASYPICMIDYEQYYTLDTVHNGLLINDNYSLKFILALLNSKFLRFLYQSQINEEGMIFSQVKIIYVDPLPMPEISLFDQQPIVLTN